MILAATGHRPDKLLGYSEEAANKLRGFARILLAEADPDTVIVGMALGWDQAVGWAAHDLDIPFIAAVPFEGQEAKWDASRRYQYLRLLGLAERVEVVSPGGYSPEKMQVRNEWMAHKSNKMLALWNGTPGGTANCVRYAESIGKPIHNVWKQFQDCYPTTH